MTPQRGEKRGLLDLAARNAALAYQSHFGDGATTAFEALDTLRGVLDLPALPRRIECFDISTLPGTRDRGVDGRRGRRTDAKGRVPEVQDQGIRRTIGRDPRHADDFAVDARGRRCAGIGALLAQGGPFPDLILIDGGKGQLSAAYAALREVGLERLVAVGLAKEEELMFTRDRAEGIALPRESPALRLVQRIRDEAHRFAVTFHRQPRTKRDFRSELDDMPASARAAGGSC